VLEPPFADEGLAAGLDLVARRRVDHVFTANLTPRKCLGYKTPFQALLAELGKNVEIRFA
jgi:IS30 family transposase